MSNLKVVHLKGCNGILRGSVAANPALPSRYYFTAGKTLVSADQADQNAQFFMRGHDDVITALACSNQGRLVATGQCGRNADVVIWDTNTLQIKYRFQEHDHEVCQLAFSQDDKLLASMGNQRDKRLVILDVNTGKIVSTAQFESTRPTAAAWSPQTTTSPNGQPSYLLATATDSSITLWALDPFKGTLEPLQVVPGSVRRSYNSLVFSPTGQWLFAGTTSGDVVTVNVARKAVQMLHPLCAGGVGGLQLLPGNEVLVAGGDGGLYRFNMENMRHDATPFARVPGPITSISRIAGGGGWLAGCANGSIHRVAAAGGGMHTHMQGHTAALRAVAFTTADPSTFATAGDDASICIWSLKDYSLLSRVAEPRVGPALCLSITPTDILSGWSDGFIRCHSRTAAPGPDGSCRSDWVLPNAHNLAHSTGTTALKRANKSHFVVTGGAGGEIRLWDLRSRTMAAHLKLHHQPISALEVLADDTHVVAACHDRSLSLWDLQEEKCRATFRSPTATVLGLVVAPDQMQMASVGNDKRITFWDIRTPEPTRVVADAHAGDVACVAINTAGTLLATGGGDDMVKLWDFRSTSLLSQVMPHSSTVSCMAFSPNDRQLVSASHDATVAVMDVA